MRGALIQAYVRQFLRRRPAAPPPTVAAPSGNIAGRFIRRKPWQPRRILDPGGEAVLRWNRVFLISCIMALFVDPLYFYLLYIGGPSCVVLDLGLGVVVTVFRTIADAFYLAHMILKFRIAFVAPSTRVFGRGELVTDPNQIAMRYLKGDFLIDLIAMLPIPQIIIWFVIPAVSDSFANHTNHTLSMIVLIQFIPRLFLVFVLNGRIIKATGVVTRTAWAGAAYNLILYMLASHVAGALWYLLSIERQYSCWMTECMKENSTVMMPPCNPMFFDCSSLELPDRRDWLMNSVIPSNCDASSPTVSFRFGIFAEALTSEIVAATFIEKYLYCLWWGLRSLTSYGQELETGLYEDEASLAMLVCITGLVLFAHLIGNMETYLQSITARLEEWRIRLRDVEEWMRHRQLPEHIQDHVRRFFQYKWLATRGVDEESILRCLPLDIRREIQRHLCLALVRRVPFFSQMDDQLLDAICERLFSSLSTKDTYILREGDPVNEMLFIIRGQLESCTTDGGRSGFFNSITLGPGDFCGEELLTWALMPSQAANLPSSTRTARALTEVEAFALRAEDLKFVSNQFRRLHSKKLQHAFRFYSHQWRTWGACFIQSAWRRYKKKKLAKELAAQESFYHAQVMDYENLLDADHDSAPLLTRGSGQLPSGDAETGINYQRPGGIKLSSSSSGRGAKEVINPRDPAANIKLAKPDEPDFSFP